jgi:hypothetical protein
VETTHAGKQSTVLSLWEAQVTIPVIDGIPYDVGHTILCDFDGTIAQYTWPAPLKEPMPGVVEALKRLKSAGYYIIIFTSRMWHGWYELIGLEEWRKKTLEMELFLERYEIPYDLISSEKRPALWIVDDRAIQATGSETFWRNFADAVLDPNSHDTYGDVVAYHKEGGTS